MGMNWKEATFVTFNAILLAIYYTLFGLFVSFIMHYIFDEFDDKWKKRSTIFKLTDVTIEISFLAFVAFWLIHIVNIAPPFFPVRKELDTLVDSYISGIFYIYAIFIFTESLTDKLKFLFESTIGKHFENIFPKYGSLADLSLHYTPTEKDKQEEASRKTE
jgi:hypothetical protein